MTREEATKYAESEKMVLESLIYNDDCKYGNYAMYSTELSFVNAVISALRPVGREQVEKVWRGEWIECQTAFGEKYNKCSRCGFTPSFGYPAFCASCGSANTGEAVQMVMERLEAMWDE